MSRSAKKLFWKMPEKSPENNCVGVSFFNKVAGCRPETFLKRDSGKGIFSCDTGEISRSSFFTKQVCMSDCI